MDKVKDIEKQLQQINKRIAALESDGQTVAEQLQKKTAEQTAAIIADHDTGKIETELFGLTSRKSGIHSALASLTERAAQLEAERTAELAARKLAEAAKIKAGMFDQAAQVYNELEAVSKRLEDLYPAYTEYVNTIRAANPNMRDGQMDNLINGMRAAFMANINQLLTTYPKKSFTAPSAPVVIQSRH